MGNFIKKNWQKDASETAINAGIRFGGAISTAFILNKWFSGEPRDGVNKEKAAKTAQTMHNISGPLFLGLGVLGDMMAENEKVKSFFQGMATISALQAIAVIAPNTSDSLALGSCKGVRGLGNVAQNVQLLSGVGALNGRARVARPALGATTDAFTGSNPKELAWGAGSRSVDTDGKTYTNDWAYLAENIDNADKISTTVNGINDEAAALMGVATNEEAALLMGMF